MNELISNGGDCRTAPATLGLLNTLWKMKAFTDLESFIIWKYLCATGKSAVECPVYSAVHYHRLCPVLCFSTQRALPRLVLITNINIGFSPSEHINLIFHKEQE